jgi:hypothetical protein
MQGAMSAKRLPGAAGHETTRKATVRLVTWGQVKSLTACGCFVTCKNKFVGKNNQV